ncbi:asparagine synthetase [glutamine-hydrolyzing] [Hydrogenimonas sp.]|nr:asparagine synthetase [glutamine-hydrolyzing] [Hydrogenimonas sp.]
MDLSDAGHQPMESDRCVIVYNGEVFNFRQIRERLVSEGMHFHSDSDTEVVLRAYEQYGMDSLKMFNGMFAFALYDKQARKLFLVRDRYGIKPLYLYRSHSQLCFASELKAIVGLDGVSVHLNKEAITAYLQFHYIPHPQTPYEEIVKLTPGSYCEIDTDTLVCDVVRYDTPSYEPVENRLTLQEAADRTETLLQDAVSLRMIADVEVGSFLSGGVDSGVITAMAAAHTGKPLQTFSVGYRDADLFDESAFAMRIARRYGTKHHRLVADFDAVYDRLEEIIVSMDEPNADTSVFLNFFLAEETKRHVSVALSGLGGDELFGGYNRHRAFVWGKYLSYLPKGLAGSLISRGRSDRTSRWGNRMRQLGRLLHSLDRDPAASYLKMISYQQLITPEIPVRRYRIEEVLKYDLTYYMSDNLLALSDRMSMAHTLEMRVPFLDYRMVSHAFALASKYKTSLWQSKIVLKKVAEKYMDHDMIYRRKQGFAAPIEQWLRREGQERISSLTDISFLSRFLPEACIRDDMYRFYVLGQDRALQIYSYLVLSLWYRLHKEYLDD